MKVREELLLKYKGLKFIVPKETECFWPYYGICFVGEYDYLLDNITKGDIVLDAGANVGIFSILASRKAHKVIAIEPDPENYGYLLKNIEANHAENIIPVNIALSDYVGSGYLSGKGPLKALSQKGTLVEVTKIDVLLRQLSVGNVNVVKMDIEGAESRALSGEYLANVRRAVVEVHDKQEIVRKILEANCFLVRQWDLPLPGVLKRILRSLIDFLDAEIKTGFLSTRLVLKYVLGFGQHPVPAAERTSEIRLLCATRLV